MTKSKMMIGMGIRDLALLNDSLLANKFGGFCIIETLCLIES